MHFDPTPLADALERLKEGLARHLSVPDDEQVRDGLIQRFEFTYDLAPRILSRALAALSPTPDQIDRMSFPTLIRTAFEQGLVKAGWPAWDDFRDMRNTTSHTYNLEKALEVVAKLPPFVDEVSFIVAQLSQER